MRRSTFVAVGAVIALALVVDLAASRPARSAGTKYLSIPAAAFVARDDSTHNGSGAPGCASQVTSKNGQEFQGVHYQGSGSFIAAAILPQNATVTSLSLWVHDNTSPEDVAVFLVRKHLVVGSGFTDGYSVMAQVSSTGGNTQVQQFTTNSVTDAVVKNGANTYFVELANCDPAATIEPIAVQIGYAP